MEWAGPWMNSLGNGPITISVPTPEDRGIQIIRSYKLREMQSKRDLAAREPEAPAAAPSTPSAAPTERVLADAPVASEERSALEYLTKRNEEPIHN
jgi:hypothetical protein